MLSNISLGLHTAKGEAVRYHNRIIPLKLNYAKYTLSIVPDINLKLIDCLSGILITSCVN